MDITVGELLDQLKGYSRGTRVVFGSGPDGLDFYRLKHRGRDLKSGDEILQVEFSQLVYRDSDGAFRVDE